MSLKTVKTYKTNLYDFIIKICIIATSNLNEKATRVTLTINAQLVPHFYCKEIDFFPRDFHIPFKTCGRQVSNAILVLDTFLTREKTFAKS